MSSRVKRLSTYLTPYVPLAFKEEGEGKKEGARSPLLDTL
jgi:hypothetical protein